MVEIFFVKVPKSGGSENIVGGQYGLVFFMKRKNMIEIIRKRCRIKGKSKDSKTKMNEVEKKVAQSAATFLASQMEI